MFAFKIMKYEYIKSTIEAGNIWFGCAELYADFETEKNKGQGDIDEGLYARVRKDNVTYIDAQRQQFADDLIEIPKGKFIDLKLRSVINMPVYCFYSMSASDPDVNHGYKPSETPGWSKRISKRNIPDKVLQDFSGVDGFGVLNISDRERFIKSIANAARKEEHRITNGKIQYVDRENKEWFCPASHPGELLFKDNSFSYQSERRVIILDNGIGFTHYEAEQVKTRSLHIPDLAENLSASGRLSNKKLRIEVVLPFCEISD